jgi:hypothetical protein
LRSRSACRSAARRAGRSGGFGAGHKKIGTVTAIREKGLATFRGQGHRALPGSYAVNLHDGDCNLLLQVDSFKADGGGDGTFAAQLGLTFGQTFFLDFYNQDQDVHRCSSSGALDHAWRPRL